MKESKFYNMNTEINLSGEKFDIFSSTDRKSLLQRLQVLVKNFTSPEIEMQSHLGKNFIKKIKLRTKELVSYVVESLKFLVAEMSNQIPKKILKELNIFLFKIEKLQDCLLENKKIEQKI